MSPSSSERLAEAAPPPDDAAVDDVIADPADAHPAVAAARRLAADLLAPRTADVDAGEVPRSHLYALGAAGLLGLTAPEHLGGAPAAVQRRVTEVLAGADLSTWFVQVQHHSPLAALVLAGGRDALVADLAAGRTLAGIAFSHVRHWPRSVVTATPLPDGGYRLDGIAPWYTGWGLNDVAFVSALDGDEVVSLLVEPRERPGLTASGLMDVAALRAARTVTLTFDGLLVPAADVVVRAPVREWLAADAARTANVVPAVFGVAASALVLLRERGTARGEPAAVDAAARLADRLVAVREAAYALIDEAPADERTEDRLRLRALAHEVLVSATTALVVAGAGGSMASSSPAQRKAREGLFLLVQAQTEASRTANLEILGRPA